MLNYLLGRPATFADFAHFDAEQHSLCCERARRGAAIMAAESEAAGGWDRDEWGLVWSSALPESAQTPATASMPVTARHVRAHGRCVAHCAMLDAVRGELTAMREVRHHRRRRVRVRVRVRHTHAPGSRPPLLCGVTARAQPALGAVVEAVLPSAEGILDVLRLPRIAAVPGLVRRDQPIGYARPYAR